MKKLICALVLLGSAQAFASDIVLRCNIGSGELQEVKIVSQGSAMVLFELDKDGATHQRAISQQELSSGKILLHTTEPWIKGTLTQSDRGWIYEFNDSGSRTVGIADCY